MTTTLATTPKTVRPFGTALALIFIYPLRKKQVEQNAAILAERRAAQA